MKLEKVKLINTDNFEESKCDIWILHSRFGNLYVEAEIDGVNLEGKTPLKRGLAISSSYYPKKFEKFFSCDHKIVEYDFLLLDYEIQRPNYRVIVYADLGQEDPANPDPEKIYFIENEEELKKYIADLIDEEENPWWDREEG